jgi:cyclopropane fatty-acyl-phospholipid synthase-like methyltransferase
MDGYVPLKERFVAWWHGREPEAVVTGDAASEPSRDLTSNAISIEKDGDWGPARLRVLEELWDTGYLDAGGQSFARKLLLALSVDSRKTVLDLTAGLGGPARLLANAHNMWMDALEPDPVLAKLAHRLSLHGRIVHQADIKHADINDLQLKQGRFDSIYSLGRLFEFSNKQAILNCCHGALKNNGLLLLFDFLRADETLPMRHFEGMKRRNQKSIEPWTRQQYHSALEKAGLSIWAEVDFSEDYIHEIRKGWCRLMHDVEVGAFKREYVDVMLDEAKVWLERSRLLERGELVALRILCSRKKQISG